MSVCVGGGGVGGGGGGGVGYVCGGILTKKTLTRLIDNLAVKKEL